MKAKFFRSSSEFRKWLEANHAKVQELWVGYYKKDSGKPSIAWPESVDEALCFGWIDGIRKSLDDVSYTIRFSPRKSRSTWSTVNIKRAQELAKNGLMQPAGLKAFEARQENRSGIYSYEQRTDQLPDPYAKIFKKNKAAWDFFQSQPPSYRKAAGWFVLSAKKEETRLKRLEQLIADSAQGRRLSPLTSPAAHPLKTD
jgi:uncharacterized protein YdeI (YjbR/CyaY-like superfamily)